MKRSVFTRCLAFLLSLSLVIGQGPLNMAMAMPASQMDHMAMMLDVSSGHDLMASNSKTAHDQGCCSHSGKSEDVKGGSCGACCIAACQAAALPMRNPTHIRYSVNQSYWATDVSATSRNPLPDPPRPKV